MRLLKTVSRYLRLKQRSTPFGVYGIGAALTIGNILLLAYQYAMPGMYDIRLPAFFLSGISIVAVFPHDFLENYLRGVWPVHGIWIAAILSCALGILRFNKVARMLFIVLNITHIVVLGYLVVLRAGGGDFLDYFFKLYFNLVAAVIYVGFLTIPEIRSQFRIDTRESGLSLWLRKLFASAPAAGGNATGYFNLGLAYSRLERFDDAVDMLKKARALNGHDPEVHFHLGQIFLKQKKVHEAIAAFKEAIQQDQFHAPSYCAIGLAYRMEGCDREAIESLEKASRMKYPDPAVHRYLGEAYLSAARYPEAMNAFREAVRQNPQDDRSSFELGALCLEQFEQPKEAQDNLRRAVRLSPETAEYHLYLGMAEIKLQRFKDAVRSLKEAIRQDEDDPRAHYHLGFSYAMLQDFDSARREHRVLQDLDPDLARNLSLVLK